MSHATLRARMGVTAATLLAGFGLSLVPAAASTASATPALHTATAHSSPAAKTHRRNSARRQAQFHAHEQKVRKVLNVARRQKGKPYAYGAAGPHAFDCSGLVRYVYGKAVHRWLPHNAAQQYHALHHIKRSHLEKGDLIFTDNGYISHVGIYAGHHRWWVAPHTGARVHKQRIYHAHFVYARVVLNHKH